MTKQTLTPELYEWFARYVHKELAWGIFHISLDDGNYEYPVRVDQIDDDDVRNWPGLMEKVEIFNQLSYSQRKKLGQKAEELERKLYPR